MNLIKAIRWGLILLTVAAVIAYPFFGISAGPSAYWLLPFLMLLIWFVLMFQPRYRFTVISLLLGTFELLPLLVLYFFYLLFGSTFKDLIYQDILLMLPLGILGIVAGVIALLPFTRQNKESLYLARIGLALASIGTVASLVWRVVTSLI